MTPKLCDYSRTNMGAPATSYTYTPFSDPEAWTKPSICAIVSPVKSKSFELSMAPDHNVAAADARGRESAERDGEWPESVRECVVVEGLFA